MLGSVVVYAPGPGVYERKMGQCHKNLSLSTVVAYPLSILEMRDVSTFLYHVVHS